MWKFTFITCSAVLGSQETKPNRLAGGYPVASRRTGEILQLAGVGEQRVLPPNLVKRWSLCCTETRSSGDKTQMPLFPAFVCGDPGRRAVRIYIGYPADDIFGLPKKGRHNFVVTYLIILFT